VSDGRLGKPQPANPPNKPAPISGRNALCNVTTCLRSCSRLSWMVEPACRCRFRLLRMNPEQADQSEMLCSIQTPKHEGCCASLVRMEWVAELVEQDPRSGFEAGGLPKQHTLRFPPGSQVRFLFNSRPGSVKKRQQFTPFFARMVRPGKMAVPVMRASCSSTTVADCDPEQRGRRENARHYAISDECSGHTTCFKSSHERAHWRPRVSDTARNAAGTWQDEAVARRTPSAHECDWAIC
jgi:hypothetical protein